MVLKLDFIIYYFFKYVPVTKLSNYLIYSKDEQSLCL